MCQQELEILEGVEVVQPTAANLAVEELNGAIVVHDIKDVSDIATQGFTKHNTSRTVSCLGQNASDLHLTRNWLKRAAKGVLQDTD